MSSVAVSGIGSTGSAFAEGFFEDAQANLKLRNFHSDRNCVDYGLARPFRDDYRCLVDSASLAPGATGPEPGRVRGPGADSGAVWQLHRHGG